MGVDTRLIDDGTYYVAEIDGGEMAGCGGGAGGARCMAQMSRQGVTIPLLEPCRRCGAHPRDVHASQARPQRDCAFHPRDERRRAEGFTRMEFVSTLAGVPLYVACGYEMGERFSDATGGVPVPLVRMAKTLR